jgi:rod shape-determining protein MreD
MTEKNDNLLLLKISLIALIVNAISLPQFIEYISPFWILIFYAYWLVYSENKAAYIVALLLGLILDVSQGDILGQNALALILSSAVILRVKKSFYVSNITTQQIYIFMASLVYLIALLITQITMLVANFDWLILFAPITSSIIWPFVRFLLAKLKH